MSRRVAWKPGPLMALGAIGLVGCFVGGHSDGGGGVSSAGPVPASGGGGGGAAVGPMLVEVDPDQTLTATPGQGIGVFIEYQSGGHWHLSWTCDTARTNLTCNFQVDVTVASGSITNLAGQLLEGGDQVVQASSAHVQAVSTTDTGIDGMTFDASPGAVITVDAQWNGRREVDGNSFIFFAQSGQPNGGYQGNVSDPLMLEPAHP